MIPFTLDKDEYVVRIVRKSLVLFFIQIIGFLVIAILPFIAYTLFTKYLELSISDITYIVIKVVFVTWILFIWISLFIRFTNYYLDSWIVTNKRIVDIDQKSLFSRTTSTLNVDKIQDVRIDIGGILRTVLGIGTLHVQTAGEEEIFIIRDASSPENVKTTILEIYHKNLEEPKTVKIQS